MLRLLKKLAAGTPPAQPVPEPTPVAAAPEKVDPYMLGLHDAMLSGWFNQQTGELFTGFRSPRKTPCWTLAAVTAVTCISAQCAGRISSSPISTRPRSRRPGNAWQIHRLGALSATSPIATHCPLLTKPRLEWSPLK